MQPSTGSAVERDGCQGFSLSGHIRLQAFNLEVGCGCLFRLYTLALLFALKLSPS